MPIRAPIHQPAGLSPRRRAQLHDQARGTAASRGYDADWQRLRRDFLAVHPMCVACAAEAIVEPATDVDHVIPVRQAPSRRLDPSNLQSLCGRHHRAKTGAERRQPGAGLA